MAALEQMVRLHRWQLDEKRRKLAQVEQLADDIRKDIEALDRELAAEEAAAKDHASAAALPAFAANCAMRRRAMEQSLAAVERSAEEVRHELHEAFREVKSYETAIKTRKAQAERHRARREQATLDEVGLSRHVRRDAGPGLPAGRRLGGQI